MLNDKKILLIISGGIAAVKSPLLASELKKQGADVTCILTDGGKQFTTDMALAALSGNKVHTNLWDADGEAEIGHIQLSRQADLIVVAPATANLLAKMTHGIGDDLASTTLLATNKPVMVFPAMNPEMFKNPATQENLKTLKQRGIKIMDPAIGEMACGETGPGRMPEIDEIAEQISHYFKNKSLLNGFHALVTSGPTVEPIDPVRYISNHSSGKQGHAIATALADAGAHVTLVTGPVNLPDPDGVKTIHVETAQEMLGACESELGEVDIAVCAAAVADFRVENVGKQKFKKGGEQQFPDLHFTENPDILRAISQHKTRRPRVVVGFAAETENLIENARVKLNKKGCDLIVANNVGENKIFGGDKNTVTFVTPTDKIELPEATKEEVARHIVGEIILKLSEEDNGQPAPNMAKHFQP